MRMSGNSDWWGLTKLVGLDKILFVVNFTMVNDLLLHFFSLAEDKRPFGESVLVLSSVVGFLILTQLMALLMTLEQFLKLCKL